MSSAFFCAFAAASRSMSRAGVAAADARRACRATSVVTSSDSLIDGFFFFGAGFAPHFFIDCRSLSDGIPTAGFDDFFGPTAICGAATRLMPIEGPV